MITVSQIRPIMIKILPNITSHFFRISLLLAVYINKNKNPNRTYMIIKYMINANGAIINESNKLQHSNTGYNHILLVPYRLFILKKTKPKPINTYGKAKTIPAQNSQVMSLIQPIVIQTTEIPLNRVAPISCLVTSLVDTKEANWNRGRHFLIKLTEKSSSQASILSLNCPDISALRSIPPKIVAKRNPIISNIFARCKYISELLKINCRYYTAPIGRYQYW